MQLPRLMTAGDTAKSLNVRRTTVHRLVRSHKLPVAAKTEGGQLLFLATDVERLRDERLRNPPRPGHPTRQATAMLVSEQESETHK